ncbi:peptidoglycan recognition protein family protein [Streptomyces sp. GMY02]|uniref:peptidoglycan recognition protein family protein n=1 Tax=Streptomyces sp. GMY02 TaxID=1333528 RepID=UPI001C2C6642|nr:peptidoglycan recognition family protein [Streptomyces sp. GMY02]QXE35441.1 peptidoglycan recognition protein family protein [Streptomyces sp. GMY02]
MVNNTYPRHRPKAERGLPASRRHFLTVLGAAAVGLPLLGACGTAQGGSAAATDHRGPSGGAPPRVRVSQAARPGNGVKRTSFPITAVGLTWTGSPRGVRLRLIDRDGEPGGWQYVTAGCPCGKDAGIQRTKSATPPNRTLVPAHGTYGYQLDVDSGVKVTEAIAIDAGRLVPERRPAPSRTPARSTPSTAPAAPAVSGPPAAPAFPPTDLVLRAAWGADEAKRLTADGRESSPTSFSRAQMITVHHTATPLDDPDPAATVRAIYEQHAVSNDWGDIGYNFLIDGQGLIYEGRYSGADGIAAHNTRNEVVTAFHTFGFNPGNIGIALLGDFSNEQPPPRMRDSLVRLTASLAARHELDPLADITYRSPTSGKSATGPALGGHQDWTSTECPGSAAYLDLPEARERAARLTG